MHYKPSQSKLKPERNEGMESENSVISYSLTFISNSFFVFLFLLNGCVRRNLCGKVEMSEDAPTVKSVPLSCVHM